MSDVPIVAWSDSNTPRAVALFAATEPVDMGSKLAALRSSRLSGQWRVLYRVQSDIGTVYVEGVSPHDYRP
jgi:hypothetical protein